MKRLTSCLSAAALAAAALLAADATTAEPQRKLELSPQVRPELRKAPNLQVKLLCSPKYTPSPDAAAGAGKGDTYTCTYVVQIPPGSLCKQGYYSNGKKGVQRAGNTVRIGYTCVSPPH